MFEEMFSNKKNEEKLSKLTIRFKKLHSQTNPPTQAYEGDAGWDLYAEENIYIPPSEQREVKIGLAFEIPKGWHMQLHTRSSFGKRQLKCHLGIIDSGYRNEVSVWVHNFGNEGYQINKGNRIAQAVFVPTPLVELVEATELVSSERGLKGHGSSGK